MRNKFKIPAEVLEKARKLGVEGSVDLQHMAEFAAPFTHPKGNRRYEQFVLKITDSVLKDINMIPAEVTRKRK